MSGIFDVALDDYANTTNKAKHRREVSFSRRGGRSHAPTLEANSSSRTSRFRTAPYYNRSRFPRGDINSQWSHDLYDDGDSHGPLSSSKSITRSGSYSSGNPKLLVENLFYEVTQDDLETLFSKIGAIKKVFLHYDRAGRSLGVADITFEDSADAAAALRKYNGTMLEGQEMRIKYAAFKASSKFSNNRGATSTSEGGSVFDRLGGFRNTSSLSQNRTTARSNLRGRLGRGSNTSGISSSDVRSGKNLDGKWKTIQRKTVTYDDLDADLDAYMAVETPVVEKSNNAIKNGDKMDIS
ncbi:hypothetical protein G9A89_003741 [Geosiphon pyriformis]|nr:hypothetical protein G9A89_003741 [Geosiphon pyriformis]